MRHIVTWILMLALAAPGYAQSTINTGIPNTHCETTTSTRCDCAAPPNILTGKCTTADCPGVEKCQTVPLKSAAIRGELQHAKNDIDDLYLRKVYGSTPTTANHFAVFNATCSSVICTNTITSTPWSIAPSGAGTLAANDGSSDAVTITQSGAGGILTAAASGNGITIGHSGATAIAATDNSTAALTVGQNGTQSIASLLSGTGSFLISNSGASVLSASNDSFPALKVTQAGTSDVLVATKSSNGLTVTNGGAVKGTGIVTGVKIIGDRISINSGAPSVSSCGSGATITATSNNQAGKVTMGTGSPTACTLTFAGGAIGIDSSCSVNNMSTTTAVNVTASSGTAFTWTLASGENSSVINYNCAPICKAVGVACVTGSDCCTGSCVASACTLP